MNAEGKDRTSQVLEKKRVEVMADNHNITVDTHADTVSEVLQQLDISIGEMDIVEPHSETKLSGNVQIRVTRITEDETEVINEIPYVTVTYHDSSLSVGTEQVYQEGIPGREKIKRSVRVENGFSKTEKIISQQVILPYTPKVVAIGTAIPAPVLSEIDQYPSGETQAGKPPASNNTLPQEPKLVTIEARPVNYKFTLDNVELTAYTAGFESTGKNPGEPDYGLTASGTTVSEGRTIAVDPTVIPMGWWVYIEGVGYRKAEDTGGVIQGNIIDVYIEDLNKATKFGRKYGNTVYVIGPEKPN